MEMTSNYSESAARVMRQPAARGTSAVPVRTEASWDTEVFVLSGASREHLLHRLHHLQSYLTQHPDANLKDLAFSINGEPVQGRERLALMAGSTADLHKRLTRATERLADPQCRQIKDGLGIYWFAEPLYPQGKIAFLFPGEGAQYFNMMMDLAQHFPEVRDIFATCDQIAEHSGYGEHAPSRYLSVSPAAPPAERQRAEEQLRQLGNAMISVLMTDWAMYHLLIGLGIPPDVMAGHSMGELSALAAAECVTNMDAVLEQIIAWMDQLQRQEEENEAEAVLLAVAASKTTAAEVVAASGVAQPEQAGVFLAMNNCPHQVVIVGRCEPMAAVEAELQKRRLLYEKLPFGRPYHTPLFEPALEPLKQVFEHVAFQTPRVPVYSSTTAQVFPSDPAEMRHLTVTHWAAPVRFIEMIEAMYADGVRLFVECGPRGNLSAFVEDILRGRSFAALAANVERRSGITQLHHLAAQLSAHHVPLHLDLFYRYREPQLLEWEPRTEAMSSTQSAVSDARFPVSDFRDGRGQVMAHYLDVMEQYLAVQQEMTEQFLSRRQRPRQAAVSNAAESAEPASCPEPEETSAVSSAEQPQQLPLLGEIVQQQPGQEIVLRRRLDLSEDLFAADHTVGGRNVSKVDPEQHGLSIMPMTFTLEMMAEAAALLLPGLVVIRVEQVKLYRWLPFDPHEPITVEMTARVKDGGTAVSVELRDLGNASAAVQTRAVAAQAVIVFAEHYPPAPLASAFPLTNERDCKISLEVLYKNLFHGPLFQGVLSTGRVGAEGITSPIEVLPRAGLFASHSDPQFLMDPVLFDVAMHPLAAWHLEQPDQSGRILLPIELGTIELFGPRPAEGTRFLSQGLLKAESARQFTNAVDVVGEDGRLWCRLHSVKYWRFYVPFGEVNFHGPKDEYFLSRPWKQNREHPEVPLRQSRTGLPFALMFLEPPADLLQAALRRVTAKVVLGRNEGQQFRALQDKPPRFVNDWLFGRIAAKDAVRILWRESLGERLFPADIEIEATSPGKALGHCLTAGTCDKVPQTAVAHQGDVAVGIASFEPRVGIALEQVQDRSEEQLRCQAARQALAQALQLSETEKEQLSSTVSDPVSGLVRIQLSEAVAARHPELSSQPLLVYTDRDGDWLVAYTLGEQETA